MRLKFFFLISGGRNGSLFLQSLLDDHPQILMLPGICYFDKFLLVLKDSGSRSFQEAGYIFIRQNDKFFDSRKDSIHGLNRLGENKDLSFEVDSELFIEYLSNFITLHPIQHFTKLIAELHNAYYFAKGLPVRTTRSCVILHVHHAKRLKVIKPHWQNWDKCTILNMERESLSSLSSEVRGWSLYSPGRTSARYYTGALYRKVTQGNILINLDCDAYTLCLEDIHKQSDRFFAALTRLLAIEDSPSLRRSTFDGKLWWGDALSNQRINGININFCSSVDRTNFYVWEYRLLTSVFLFKHKMLGYPLEGSKIEKLNLLRLGKLEKACLKADWEQAKNDVSLKGFFEFIVLFFIIFYKKIVLIKKIEDALKFPNKLEL